MSESEQSGCMAECILGDASELGIFMSSFAVPSFPFATTFPSATNLVQHPAAAASAAVAPWRMVLAVEPDVAVLRAKSLLLTKANYCVTQASSDHELFSLRGMKAVALALLSDRFGQRLLGTVAATVRKQWPRARILIIGQAPSMLEDYLYDEQIERSADPQQVLDKLEALYEGMWNQRSNTLDWRAARPVLCFPRPAVPESDAVKHVARDTPSDILIPRKRMQ